MSEASTVPAKRMNEVNRFIGDKKRRAAKAELKAKTEVIHLQGEQVNADTLVQNAYAVVTYYENNKLKRENGRIKAIGDTSFAIRNSLLGKTTIAYAKVLSVFMGKDAVMSGKQMNAMDREIKKIETETEVIQQFKTHNSKVRIKAPSISKRRIIGDVVKMTQDTLLIRKGRTFLEVPMSSISNFEVNLGKQRNADKGFKIGLGLGLAVLVPVAVADYSTESKWQGLATFTIAVYISLPIAVLSALIGAGIESDKWVEVSPQRLDLSIAPTPEKGLRAALTVNF